MYQMLGILVAFIIVLTTSMYVLSVLASKMVTRAVQTRLRALEQITNGQIPDDWLRPFQRRVVKLRQASANEAQFARLGKRIQQQCVRRLDEMTRYTTNINFADGETTRRNIIETLKTQQQTWPTKGWSDWITSVETLDTPKENQEADLTL